ncbi:hypothetical protein KKB18_04560 [bacterium]|nr:hypothetical protein [bacterium]
MQTYRNSSGDSSVIAYENGEDYIIVKFATGMYKTYTYTNISAGITTIRKMQQLADYGRGLNSYIQRWNPKYSKKS